MISQIFVYMLAVTNILASPLMRLDKRQEMTIAGDVQIHESCNSTSRRQLTKALSDMKELVELGRNHIAMNGSESPIFTKYFGNGDMVTVLGALDALLSSNKEGVLLRCDDPDGNCKQPEWNGHWRGSNATLETVICDLSYESRKPLEQFCALGYTVAGSNPNTIFANDLVHRLFHIPSIADEEIGHVDGGDTYTECLELAKNNASWAPLNTHSIQYFLAEVYAWDVAAPGQGCLGAPAAEEVPESPSSATSSTADLPSSTLSATSTAAEATLAPSPTASIGCEPHGDHWHCDGPRPAAG